MTPSADELICALGKQHIDPDVASILDRLGIRKKIKLARGEFDLAIAVPHHGVDIVFSTPGLHEGENKNVEGALIFSAVIFFSENRENHHQFPLSLPAGLKFEMSKADLRKKLGAPEFTNEFLCIDRWPWKNVKLGVTYVDSLSAIADVNCDLPKIL